VRTAAERFWEKVRGGDVETCWLWTGAKVGPANGYGSFIVAWPAKTVAHRWAYEQLIAPVPPGLDLDHLCRNRSCVNPWHLDPVTRKVNLNRGIHANAAKTQCRSGHAFTEVNTRINSRGSRECRECIRIRSRGYRATKRLARSMQPA
jgi:hypothetical protein